MSAESPAAAPPSVDDLALRLASRLPAALRAKSTVSTATLQALRSSLDGAGIRDDALMATCAPYRRLVYEMTEFCGTQADALCSLADLRTFFILRGVLVEALRLPDVKAQADMMAGALRWFEQHRQGGESGAVAGRALGRLAGNRFRDYSDHMIERSTLPRLRGVVTRDLVASHAARTNSTPDLVAEALRAASRYAPRPASPASSAATHDDDHHDHQSIMRTALSPSLDDIWLQKREREANDAQLQRHMRALLQRWGARRARVDEEIARRQESSLYARRHALQASASTPALLGGAGDHFKVDAWSLNANGTTRPWAVSQDRHDVPGVADPPALQLKPAPDLAAVATLPGVTWRATGGGAPIHKDDRLSVQEMIAQRQGSTRSLFNPQAALTVNMSYGDVVVRGEGDARVAGSRHVDRCDDMREVDKIKATLERRGVHIGRAVLERALVEPMADLSAVERAQLFPIAGEGLIMNGNADSAAKAGKSSAKGKKGGKSKKKKKKK